MRLHLYKQTEQVLDQPGPHSKTVSQRNKLKYAFQAFRTVHLTAYYIKLRLCTALPPPPLLEGLKMSTATRQEVLGLYRSIFRLARKWRAASGQVEDTIKEKQYILSEAGTLFQKNKNLTDPDLIKQCIDECTARIEMGLHYQIPYPRPIHLPPMALTPLRGRRLQSQEKLRKLSKPVYLQSHDEVS